VVNRRRVLQPQQPSWLLLSLAIDFENSHHESTLNLTKEQQFDKTMHYLSQVSE
jgi:hypothetical protein